MSGFSRLTVNSSSFWQPLLREDGGDVKNTFSQVWAPIQSMLASNAGLHTRGFVVLRKDRFRKTKPST